MPGKQGQSQTDFVISDFVEDEYKKCALDLVNSVIQLAFLEPEYAKELKFDIQYIKDNKQDRDIEEDCGPPESDITSSDSDDELVESEDDSDDELVESEDISEDEEIRDALGFDSIYKKSKSFRQWQDQATSIN